MRRLFSFLAVLIALVLVTAVPALAQDGAGGFSPTPELCLQLGGLIAVAVSLLKRLPFGIGRLIAKNPKTCAAVLNALGMLAPHLLGHSGATVSQIALCIAAGFTGSVGTYEVLLKPAGKLLALPDPKLS